MDTVAIRQAITEAKRHEYESGHMAQRFIESAKDLHRAINLLDDNAVPILLNFVIRYIDHVPEFIDAVEDIANLSGLNNYTDPVIHLVQEFFARPPKLMDGQQGLIATMGEAYLSHRLIEDINDRFMSSCSEPLVPMDMTRSNLIIHHLIGEPFSNQLDYAVRIIVDGLELNEDVFSGASLTTFAEEKRKGRPGIDMHRWPCLADNMSINLTLKGHQKFYLH